MAKTLLRYDCLEDKNGDLLISISGLSKEQKEKIISTIALSITQTGLDLSFVKDQTPVKKNINLDYIFAMDKNDLEEYILTNKDNIKDYRSFGYILFKYDHPLMTSVQMNDFAEADCLDDEEWKQKVKDILPSVLKEITNVTGSDESAPVDEFVPAPEVTPFEDNPAEKDSSTKENYNPFS